MAPKYGVGKRVIGSKGINRGIHGVISNRLQVNGTWWLDVTWSNGQVTRVKTGDVNLEGVGGPINVPVQGGAREAPNNIGVVDRDGSEDDNSSRADSSEGSEREDIGDLDG